MCGVSVGNLEKNRGVKSVPSGLQQSMECDAGRRLRVLASALDNLHPAVCEHDFGACSLRAIRDFKTIYNRGLRTCIVLGPGDLQECNLVSHASIILNARWSLLGTLSYRVIRFVDAGIEYPVCGIEWWKRGRVGHTEALIKRNLWKQRSNGPARFSMVGTSFAPAC